MAIRQRNFGRFEDYESVARFLVRSGSGSARDFNWLRSRWDYMHTHPQLERATLDRIGIWEDDGEIVAVANHEDVLGTAYCHFAPGYRDALAKTVVDYAETNLAMDADGGGRLVRIFAHEADDSMAAALRERGFAPDGKSEPTAVMPITGPALLPGAVLPTGFELISLAEEDDLVKVDRVMWRGFNHPGEPPAGSLTCRALMQSGPQFRHDLTMVVRAPNGDYASIAGHWYEPVNRTALVEPVATDPRYRRLGCGRAAVLEGLRRCAAEGATMAYVGSEQPFYYAIGFSPGFRHLRWTKKW